MALQWKYNNDYGFMCQAKTEAGYYTILQDEDKCGEPLFLEFHNGEEEYCTDKADNLTLEGGKRLEELQQTALEHALSLE